MRMAEAGVGAERERDGAVLPIAEHGRLEQREDARGGGAPRELAKVEGIGGRRHGEDLADFEAAFGEGQRELEGIGVEAAADGEHCLAPVLLAECVSSLFGLLAYLRGGKIFWRNA